MASLSSSGLDPISAAIAGSDVAMTVVEIHVLHEERHRDDQRDEAFAGDAWAGRILGVRRPASHRQRRRKLPARGGHAKRTPNPAPGRGAAAI